MWFLLGTVIVLLALAIWMYQRKDPVERDQNNVSDALWLDHVDAELALAKSLFQDKNQADYSRAYEILQHLAQQYELAEAYVYMAFMQQHGLGRQADVEAAIHLLENAHQRSSEDASYYLGEIYRAQGNPAKALFWYQYGVARGCTDAQYQLAEHYATGQAIEKNLEKAQKIWMDAARKGHAAAQYRLGQHLWHGDLFEQDQTLAKQYLHQAAQQKHPQALALLHEIEQSVGMIHDTDLSLNHLKQQAFSGDEQARTSYCLAVLKGMIDADQRDAVLALLTTQAKQQHASSLCLLGFAYAQGLGVDVNLRQAFQYWTRAAALKDPIALCALAQLHKQGEIVVQDLPQAFALYQQAYASAELPLTQFLLGMCYLYGEGTSHQPQQALNLIQAAAQQQFALHVTEKAQVLYSLGLFYADQLNPFADFVKAEQYLTLAAEQGETAAARELGLGYLNAALALPQDDEKARAYLTQAAAQGDVVAHSYLAVLKLFARGGEQNYAEALVHLQQAVAANHAFAMAYLAQCYENGWGVATDMQQALGLYQQAIALGEAEAYYHMGRLYAQGHGVVRDLTQAQEWLTQAKNLGHVKADKLLTSLIQEYLV